MFCCVRQFASVRPPWMSPMEEPLPSSRLSMFFPVDPSFSSSPLLSGEQVIFSESQLGSQFLHYSVFPPHLMCRCSLNPQQFLSGVRWTRADGGPVVPHTQNPFMTFSAVAEALAGLQSAGPKVFNLQGNVVTMHIFLVPW